MTDPELRQHARNWVVYVTIAGLALTIGTGAIAQTQHGPGSSANTAGAMRSTPAADQLDIDRESADAAYRTADYTFYMVMVAAAQTIILIGQLGMFFSQLRTMNIGMQHSETVAKTALAALDKPWLFITRPRHNQSAWVNGEDGLNVVFSLTNYGKAPAIILSIRGALFPSPGPRAKVSGVGPADAMEGTGIIDFPALEELQQFKTQWSRSPRSVSGSVTFRPRQDPAQADTETVDAIPVREATEAYVAPIVVGEKETAGNYWISGPPAFAAPERGVPIQSVMNIYFIGTVLYHGPDEQVQSIDFCYESAPRGELRTFRGAPYNERRKAS